MILFLEARPEYQPKISGKPKGAPSSVERGVWILQRVSPSPRKGVQRF